MNNTANNIDRQTTRRAQVKVIVHERREQLNSLKKILRLGLTLTNKDHSSWAVFLEDASELGKFRYQTFDVNGFSGHCTYNSLAEALNDAFVCGYKILDDGALDRVAGTDQWNIGMKVGEVRDLYNRGILSFNEMFSRIKEINASPLAFH